MPRRGFSLAKSMAVVAILAADFAVLRAGGRIIPNPGLVLMVVVLELGLFPLASRRGPARAFWLGFEVAGWAYVLAHTIWSGPIWRWSKSAYEAHILGRQINGSDSGFRFVLTAGAFQLGLSFLLAVGVGLAMRAVARGRQPTPEIGASNL